MVILNTILSQIFEAHLHEWSRTYLVLVVLALPQPLTSDLKAFFVFLCCYKLKQKWINFWFCTTVSSVSVIYMSYTRLFWLLGRYPGAGRHGCIRLVYKSLRCDFSRGVWLKWAINQAETWQPIRKHLTSFAWKDWSSFRKGNQRHGGKNFCAFFGAKIWCRNQSFWNSIVHQCIAYSFIYEVICIF